MKKELFFFVFLFVFITLIDLGAQIRGIQTRYTVVNFGLNQPLVHNVELKTYGYFLSVSLPRQAFIQALLSTAVFPQRFSFFTVGLVHYL